MAEYNIQIFKQMNHRICLSVLSKWVTEFSLVFQINKCVTVTELEFVFDNKTIREHLKKY